jgi:tetratricopeptide (TPR) repeat protein
VGLGCQIRSGPGFLLQPAPFPGLRGRHQTHIQWITALLDLSGKDAVAEKDRATLLNNIGGVYDALGEKQRALEYYEQALPLYRQVGDRSGEATTLNNIAIVYYQQGGIERAAEMFRQSIQIYREVGAVQQEANTLYNLAVVLHTAQGQTEEAMEPIRRSITILERYNLPQDSFGRTLVQHQAFLAQLRGT